VPPNKKRLFLFCKMMASLVGHDSPVYGVAFSPDGHLVATASHDKVVKVWSGRGEFVRDLRGHKGQVWSVDFCYDGTLLVSAGGDNRALLWSTRDWTIKATLGPHSNEVVDAKFSRQGGLVATASLDYCARVFKVSGELVHKLQGFGDWVRSVSWAAGGWLSACSDDKKVRLFDAKSGSLMKELSGHAHRCLDVAVSPDDALIASASSDDTARVWRASGECVATLKGHTGAVTGVAWRGDGRYLATVGWDGRLLIWDLSWEVVEALEVGCPHQEWVCRVRWGVGGDLVAATNESNEAKMISVSKCVRLTPSEGVR
jgi:WD40 repeat protein